MRQNGVDLHGEGRVLVLEDRLLIGLDGDLDYIAARAWGSGLVRHRGADFGLVQGQFFELPRVCTADRVDRGDHWRIGAHVYVVRRGHGDRTGGAVGRYHNNGLAITEGEVQRRVVVERQAVFAGQRDGVGDLATFGDGLGSRQLGHHFADGIGHLDRSGTAQLQVLEDSPVDICRRLDAQTDLAGVVVDVIALRVVSIRRAGIASLDGDLGIVAQGHDQVVLQRGIDVYGEGRLEVLSHRGLVGGDGDLYQIALVTSTRSSGAWFVGYGGGDGITAERQLLEVVRTRYGFQLVRDSRLTTDINVIGDRDGRGTRRVVGRDGDFRPITQSEGQCAVLSNRQALRVGQGDGVGHLATLGYGGLVDGQSSDDFTDGVRDFNGRRPTKVRLLESGTRYGSVCDAEGDRASVLDYVITLGRGLVLDFGLASFDGHGVAVGQSDSQRTVQCLAYFHGEGRLLVFGHIAIADDAYGDSIDTVTDHSRSWCRIRGQLLEVAACGAFDGYADGRAVVVYVVGRGLEVNTALGFTGFDGNGLAVGQGHGHRGLRRVAQGHGVGDDATFGHRRVRRQGRGGVVERVVDRGLSRSRIRRQLLEVAARGALDGDADGRTVVVDVVGRGLEVNTALGFTGFDGNGLAVGQGHGHRGLGRVAQGHGVGDDAAFSHAWRSGQGRGGSVDGIGNLGNRWCLRHCHGQPAAPGGARYGRRNLAAVDIRGIVCRNHDVDAARGLPGRNDYYGPVGKGDHQVGARCLANRSGINDYATRFADGRGSAKNQVGSNAGIRRRRSYLVVAGGIQHANLFAIEHGSKAQPVSREADGRVDPARGFFEHDKAVATAQCATTARRRWASRSRFKLGSRVDTGSDRLLQLFHRWRGLRGCLAQVGAAVRRISAPLAVSTQVEQTAIGQFQSNCTARAGEHFLTGQQAVPFDQNTPNALWGYRNNLADNTFDDGYNAAHWTLRVTRWVLPCQSGTCRPLQAELCR
ncbi:hypothetical protein D3C78_499130 [compost metagenome]